MTFPGLLIFWPPKILTSTPPPWVGMSIFLGRNHPQICRDLCILNPFSDLFFAFKVTISRHFAGYASVVLETIWLHEPRDLIFLGPPMTLLCLSRYSTCSEGGTDSLVFHRIEVRELKWTILQVAATIPFSFPFHCSFFKQTNHECHSQA